MACGEFVPSCDALLKSKWSANMREPGVLVLCFLRTIESLELPNQLSPNNNPFLTLLAAVVVVAMWFAASNLQPV